MTFSLKDFAEPGDRITNFATGERYILCAGHTEDGVPCPFFIESNYSHEIDPEGGWAEYVHLHRGDEADEAMDDHDAIPGESHPLSWWRELGPDRVRERFID